MKFIHTFVLLVVLAFSLSNVNSQDAVLLGHNPDAFAVGDSCFGPGSLRYDDGTLANGGGWNTTVTDGRWVLKFTPVSYPWNFTKFCIALTRISSGTANMNFDVVVYDTTGAGGAPGAVVTTIAGQTATGILVFPAFNWFNFSLATVPALTSGSYYIGIKYSAAAQTGQFVMFDEAPTLLRTGYGWANTGPWTAAQTYFSTYRCWGMRTEGTGVVLAPLCEQFTSTTFPPTGWTNIFTGTPYWMRSTASGFGVGQGSAKYDMWNASSGTNQTLQTLTFMPSALCGGPPPVADSLIIDMAFSPYQTAQDSLVILTSTDGGTTYSSFRRLGPTQLQTTAPQTTEFTPTAGQWAKRSYALPVGTNKIQFLGKSQFGNNLYLDSICIKSCLTGIIPIGIEPVSYSLSQNYPNPFNPTTNIKFGLPTAGIVKLVVFDVLGREVATLVNEFKGVGQYVVDFDASSLASGIYFYKIEAGDFVETKKMLLVK